MYKKKVTINDIAKKAKVSPTSVSLILNNRSDARIPATTRDAVLAAAGSLGYIVKPKNTGNARTIMFVHGNIHSSNIGTSFFSMVASEMRTAAAKYGMHIIETEFQDDDSLLRFNAMLAASPAAFVSYTGAFSAFLKTQQVKIPLFTLQGQDDPDGAVNYIVDDYMVGEYAAKHLLAQGYRKAGIVFPKITPRCAEDRYEGFTAAFKTADSACKLHELADYSHAAVETFMMTVPLTCDSWYFFSDACALAGMRSLLRRGVAVPKDAGVIGTDNLYWSRFFNPSLTTMDLNERVFAERIIDDVHGFLGGRSYTPLTVRIPVSLIERESTARRNKAV
ncbi:MAG: LacI family DNA-binding transcriptional regulator [Spirochaetes bacterium]|nr:LacI family DNA-binding transcriptional regulator [Spirochaetota bacterium]